MIRFRGKLRFPRDVRLIPLVVVAVGCLFVLKVSGLVLDGGYTLGERLAAADQMQLKPTTPDTIPEVTPIIYAGQQKPQPQPPQPWAREMLNFGDVTGAVGGKDSDSQDGKDAKAAKDGKDTKDTKDNKNGKVETAAKPPIDPPPSPDGKPVALDPSKVMPPGERAVLERLQDRRQQLEARGSDIEMREELLKAAEKRLEARISELKGIEERITSVTTQRDQDDAKRLKSVVAMYENMKPKDAARIFDRLDMKILVDVTNQINPRKMSEILAQMTPEQAERLTVELANQAAAQSRPADVLPQIEGKPSTP